MIMEAKKSQICHLQGGESGKITVQFSLNAKAWQLGADSVGSSLNVKAQELGMQVYKGRKRRMSKLK